MKSESAKNFFSMVPPGGGSIYSYPIHSHDHVIYIDDLSWLEDHQDRLQVIRQATPDDSIRIVINSPGGCVNIAMAYISAIRESQAEVITHAEGQVCSAGTVLWLASKDRSVSPLTVFMFHNYQGGAIGDGANMYSQIVFEKQYFDRLIDKFYTGVLTAQEIATIKGGGQVWMDEVEILKRTKAMLLDDKNIERLRNGMQPLISGDKLKDSATKSKNKEEVTEETVESLVAPKKLVLKVTLSDGESVEIDVESIKESDFDAFNTKELISIAVQIKGVIFDSSKGEFNYEGYAQSLPKDRKGVLKEILDIASEILATYGTDKAD